MTALSVAVVRARYNPQGGAERYAQRAMSALSQAGVDVSVIARRWSLPRDEAASAGERASCGMPALLRVDPFHVGSLWRDASFAHGVRALLRRQRFDLVQSHERIAGVSLYRAGDGVHASYLEARSRVLPAWRAQLMRLDPHHRWVLREERAMFTHPALRAVICNSQAVLEDIAQRFGLARERLHLLRNGIDLEQFQPPSRAQREAARSALALPSDAPVFAFVGSGFERKGLSTAIRALAGLRSSQAVLLVAGTDRHLRRHQALAESLGITHQVRFLGALADVRPVLRASDGFLAPALYDPYPNAALEALACGLPLIASKACGVSELVQPACNGFVHDALDLAAFTDSMARLVGQANHGAMREAARAAALPWSLDQAAQALLSLYRRLLAESAAP